MFDSWEKQIDTLFQRLNQISVSFEIEEKLTKAKQLEKQSLRPDFWENPDNARTIMREISFLKTNLDRIDKLTEKLTSLKELIELSKDDQEIKKDIANEVKIIEKDLSEFETVTFLSGLYDQSDAILSIHAGQGGTEAMDWVAMLLRMYLKYFANKNWNAQILNEIPGEEAGAKSVTVEVSGDFAYGYLKNEAGVHRLVRLSPFNANNLRQTSFALVEVLPEIDEQIAIEIRPEDLEFEAFRSGGHGGQNVNKVSTAVRIKHKLTGIVVTCQTQRYQAQNRDNALKILRAKLWQLEEGKMKKEKEKLKGAHITPGWGNQIRSYVLHPYKMVKDLRTGYLENDAEKVLDGQIEQFIQATLRKT